MATTIVPHPMLEDAVLGRDASHINHPVLTAPSIEERASKRARANEAKSEGRTTNVPFKKRLGCLSELPTMPLDILYEIFGHLSPADLLSLGRLNKDFRRVLVTRKPWFLWKTALGSCDAPPCPEDMSPPAWSHLLFGGTYCYSCGAPRVTKILFSLRRRACKSCLRFHLYCSSKVPKEYRDMIRFYAGYTECAAHPSMSSCGKHWWDEDVEAFRSKLTTFKPKSCGPDGVLDDTRVTVSEFLARERKMVAGIQEHAPICLKWEAAREMKRSAKSTDIKNKRFEYIRAQFPSPHYREEDVRGLRDVSIGKPMSDQAWKVLEPRLRPLVNNSRHQRLKREGGKGYLQRWEVVTTQYSNFLKTLPPLSGLHQLVRAPPALTEFLCENQALADAVAFGGDHDSPEFRAQVSEAISRLAPDVKSRDCAGDSLTVSLPNAGGASRHASATDEEVLNCETPQ
ncbi:hypothetical protein BGW80DRAFT_744092 [Lactifluus volemus]|nr:hypothetical protein BGW80DRAFT_744092 [Lactifluus volemus]